MSIHPLLHGALPLSSLKACPIDAQEGEVEKSKKKTRCFWGFGVFSTDFDFEQQKLCVKIGSCPSKVV